MTDDTLIADLIRAAVAPELVARVVRAIEIVRDSPGHVRDIVRAYETGRKRTQRKNSTKSGGKQTMSALTDPPQQSESVPDKGVNGHLLTNLSFLEEPTKERKVKREQASLRRGSRLVAGTPIIDGALEFASQLGFDSVASLWAEFVDYWSAVPGARGVKLDWLATWRNHCRRVADRQGIAPPLAAAPAPTIPQPPRPGLPTHEELKARYATFSRNAG